MPLSVPAFWPSLLGEHLLAERQWGPIVATVRTTGRAAEITLRDADGEDVDQRLVVPQCILLAVLVMVREARDFLAEIEGEEFHALPPPFNDAGILLLGKVPVSHFGTLALLLLEDEPGGVWGMSIATGDTKDGMFTLASNYPTLQALVVPKWQIGLFLEMLEDAEKARQGLAVEGRGTVGHA